MDASVMMESSFVSMKAVVEFLNIQDQYCYRENLNCTFRLNDYTPQEGDRLGIFKLGWSSAKDYVVFEWVPTKFYKDIFTVIFNKHMLPKNSDDIYQICYINGENELFGASSTFQFTSGMVINFDSPPPTSFNVEEDDNEELKKKIMYLKAENNSLISTLQYVLSEKCQHHAQKYDQDITELVQETRKLKVSLENQQKEMKLLISKVMGGIEEYKLNIEKHEVEEKQDQVTISKEEPSKLKDKKSGEIASIDEQSKPKDKKMSGEIAPINEQSKLKDKKSGEIAPIDRLGGFDLEKMELPSFPIINFRGRIGTAKKNSKP